MCQNSSVKRRIKTGQGVGRGPRHTPAWLCRGVAIIPRRFLRTILLDITCLACRVALLSIIWAVFYAKGMPTQKALTHLGCLQPCWRRTDLGVPMQRCRISALLAPSKAGGKHLQFASPTAPVKRSYLQRFVALFRSLILRAESFQARHLPWAQCPLWAQWSFKVLAKPTQLFPRK